MTIVLRTLLPRRTLAMRNRILSRSDVQRDTVAENQFHSQETQQI